MVQTLSLHFPNRNKGSYYRKGFIGDVLYYCFIYRDLHITFAKKGRKNTILSDATADLLLEKGLITEKKYHSYKEKVCSLFSLETLKDFDEYSLEELYDFVTQIRRQVLGNQVLNNLQKVLKSESKPLDFEHCLDQRSLIEEVCKEKETILIAINESELYATMWDYLKRPCFTRKNILFITSETGVKGLSSQEELKKSFSKQIGTVSLENGKIVANNHFDLQNSALLIFGESGLLDARNLKIPCGVFCKPKGYHACAVAGQLGLIRPAAVYVPSGFSIVEHVPITKRTRLNYLILAKLSKAHGKEVYDLPVQELYTRFPKYFMNVYESDPEVGTENVLEPILSDKDSFISAEDFDLLRNKAIKKHLDGFENCRYFTKTYTEEDGVQGKILVHGVCIKKSGGAQVIPCGKSTPLRKKMREINRDGCGIVSNFLYFLTPKLGVLFNNLRHDRKEEMAEVDAGHMDYLLEYREGIRVETFPLFRKTCIALKENGEFIFFNFRLGGGTVQIGNQAFSWAKDAVDPGETNKLSSVCIFTPYCSLPDSDADRETYRKAVGNNRVNFVVIQDRITAIRSGDVLIPGMGVVISMSKEPGEKLCRDLGLVKNQNGYYDPTGLGIKIELDPPEEIGFEEWKTVKWSYGGGLSLILDGKAISDGDRMDQWFEQDGWTSPLSRQTQESTLHTLVKHPRTAIGITKDGSLVILVFSGRTEFSDGADYREMCLIARDLVPDIHYLMNVDGGGSAMLGMVQNGTFTELSLPSTSTGSTVGMVRPINTIFYIPLN